MRIRNSLKVVLIAGAATFALAACGEKTAAPPAPASGEDAGPAPAAAVNYDEIAAAAVADPARSDEDRSNDARRKPATALAFMQVKPGLSVFEMEAGGGWYTELLSHAVGESGSVVMQNPEGFLAFVGEEINARLANDRLSNVRQSLSVFDALDTADGSIDLVTWVQGPHELYYTPDDGTFLGDPFKSYAEIYRILKPGGAFVVIDHSAVPGSPETTGNELHRIDRSIVVDMAEGAGFMLEADSGFLANPDDSRTANVFDPSIRGYTDQFALRFRKP
ncbi:MAG: class I SAM-dependent methyltransferase [Pseudomonadota bacterium]|nr:class I SAM-dependent methyltransferase [Pseudomonadota bacterium]